MSSSVDDGEIFTELEIGKRQALLEVRSFIIKHCAKDVDAYCAQRLHDIRMDAEHRQRSSWKMPWKDKRG